KRSVVGDQTSTIARFFGCSYIGLYPIVLDGQVVGCIYMESRQPRRELQLWELRQLGQLRVCIVTAMRRVRGSS
ncbi:MAG TPA: GAF domain-containing protein, partial [Bryobacteraceae bacterium]